MIAGIGKGKKPHPVLGRKLFNDGLPFIAVRLKAPWTLRVRRPQNDMHGVLRRDWARPRAAFPLGEQTSAVGLFLIFRGFQLAGHKTAAAGEPGPGFLQGY